MNTINKSFNNAWELLKQYHEETDFLPQMVTLDFSNRPKFNTKPIKYKSNLKQDREWFMYFDAIQTILIIGKRGGWLKTHVDGKGYPIWLAVDKKFNKEK